MGVFATRSPFRPNPLGLSCVKIEEITSHPKYGTVITVSGADLMDNTPIYDIKPYLPYVDSHPEASNGFALERTEGILNVSIPDEWKLLFPADRLSALYDVLAQDPRPQYQNSPERIYTMSFAGFDISFTVNGDELTVCGIREILKYPDR